MFFQIRKDGNAVDGNCYASLAEASGAMEAAAKGGEVAEVDGLDRIIRRYTLEECRQAVRDLRHEVRR